MILISKVSYTGYWSEAAGAAPGKWAGGGEQSHGEGHVQEVQGGTEENKKKKNKEANKQKMIEKKGEGNSRKYALWKYVIL